MSNNATVITHAQFLKITYRALSARVAPRAFSSLTFRLSGEVSIFTTEDSFVSSPRSVTFIPAGYEYETTVHKAGEMLIMHFESAEGSPNVYDRPFTVRPEHADDFINLYMRAIRHFQSDRHLDCMADAYRLLAEVERAMLIDKPKPYKRLADIKRHIDESICDSTLRVAALAEDFGTSEVYFRREFKKFYDCTPIEYIKKRRIELACQLLTETGMSVKDISSYLSFEDEFYFSGLFRRKMGISPTQYRKKMQTEPN